LTGFEQFGDRASRPEGPLVPRPAVFTAPPSDPSTVPTAFPKGPGGIGGRGRRLMTRLARGESLPITPLATAGPIVETKVGISAARAGKNSSWLPSAPAPASRSSGCTGAE